MADIRVREGGFSTIEMAAVSVAALWRFWEVLRRTLLADLMG